MVKRLRNKARVKENLIREPQQKSLFTATFNALGEIVGPRKAVVQTIRRNWKNLAAITHLDVGGCEDNFKTIHRTYAFLNHGKPRKLYDEWRLEKTEDELSRNNKWSD